MGTVTISASNVPAASGVGSGVTSDGSSAVLCRMNLTAAERGATFRGLAISSTGEKREVAGLGYMVPEVGWVLHADGDDLVLTDGATLELTVTGGSGEETWIGSLSAVFESAYSWE